MRIAPPVLVPPHLQARAAALAARTELSHASDLLEPTRPDTGFIGIPELWMPAAPDNPWGAPRTPTSERDMRWAARLVGQAASRLRDTESFAAQLPAALRDALRTAARHALAGVAELRRASGSPDSLIGARSRIDAATIALNQVLVDVGALANA
ncbi:MAG: hypothetical protein JWM25_1347 [Thermoleophilia bacterium]|nr:hypothetical protein [Thermoleophilia bacterium]MCZ4496764.1 hypothetical protein [Thermoleophilia bacterium]